MNHTNHLIGKITSALSSAVLLLTSAVSAAPVSAENAQTDNYAKLLQYSLYFYDANR